MNNTKPYFFLSSISEYSIQNRKVAIKRTGEIIENGRMINITTKNKADIIWADQGSKVETLRYSAAPLLF